MISPRIVSTILRKDVVDAVREGRVIALLLTPILLGGIYSVVFRDAPAPEVKLAYVAPDGPALLDAMRERVGRTLDLKVTTFDDEADARDAIRRGDAAVALVVPRGFEAAVRGGSSPSLTVITTPGTSASQAFLLGTLDGVLRGWAGQRPPAVVMSDVVDRPSEFALIATLGPRVYFVIGTIVMMVGFVGIGVVPMLLAEESEKRTLDALLMVGSYLDVILGKALVGIAFVLGSLAVMMGIARLRPDDPVLFFGTALLLTTTIVGFGLLIGGLFRSANQVSSWGSFLLIPVIGPAFAVGTSLPPAGEQLLRFLPTSQAVRIFGDAMTSRAMFDDAAFGLAVIVAWGLLAFGLLAWRLSRREA